MLLIVLLICERCLTVLIKQKVAAAPKSSVEI